MSVTRDGKVAAWLLAGVYLFSGLSPVATSFDSRWTVFIAMSLWRHGTTDLDDYSADIPAGDYSVHYDGHWRSIYPIAGPVLTAPLVIAAVGVMHLLHPILGRFHSSHPVVEGFLRADFKAAHPLIEMEVASFLVAITTVVMYFIARRYLSERRALILALLFALATPAYSVAGRALWQHTPSMLLLATILSLLLRAGEKPSLAAWAGLPVALSYTVRPTDALFVIFFTAYVAVRYRPYLVRYLLAAAPVAALFAAYNFSIYHQLLTPYYHSPLDGFSPRNWPRFGEALAGNLITPSRGLLVYTPVFFFSIWSMIRGLWQSPLKNWLSALTLAHWVAVSSFVACWWAGMCYGPRFFTDLTPVLVLFLIPYLAHWERLSPPVRALFVTCALIGLALHLKGGWSAAVYEWNTNPSSVDLRPARNWDWRDPQFLR